MFWLSDGRTLHNAVAGRFSRQALLAAAGMLVLGQKAAVAGTFNVNSTADILNPTAGTVTLRSAIQAANSTPGGNTINLTLPGTYKILLTDPTTGTSAFTILPGGGDLSIINTSGGVVVVDAGQLDRVFDINPKFDPTNPTPAFTVTMQGFTVTGGDPVNTGPNSFNGGGIRSRGNASLTLTNMAVTANHTFGGGGGIAMDNAVSAAWTLTLNNTLISNNVALNGGGIETDGSGNVVISGGAITGNTAGNGGGIFLDPTPVNNVLIDSANLTIQGADISSNRSLGGCISFSGNGGAIMSSGNGAVTITDSTFHDNLAVCLGGALIIQCCGPLTISNSHLINNTAISDGGALYTGTSSVISFTEIDGNTSLGSGGGVFANGTTLSIQNSTVAHNIFDGIELQTTGTGNQASNITNSTISNNGVGLGTGGGLDASAKFTGALNLLGVTISDNSVQTGGGIFWTGTTGSSVTVQNSIIAKNTAGLGPDANNLAGTFTDNGGNLIGVSGTGSGNTGFTANTTQTGTTSAPLDPLLGSLLDHGGPTRTLALLAVSPAIDKAIASSLTTDQRGVPRPQGAQPDIGAYELNQGPTPMASLSTNLLDFGSQGLTESTVLAVTLSSTGTAGLLLSKAAISGANASDFSFTPQAACTPLPVTLPSGQFCNDTVKFSPTALGLRNATLTFTDNHMNAPNSQQSVALTGSGAASGPPDFSVSASPSSATVTRGGSATFTFTVTPVNGFNQAVTFLCAGLPALAQCNFAPPSVTPNGSPTTSMLTITTTAPINAGLAPRSPNRLGPLYASLSLGGLLAGLVVAGIGNRHKRSRRSGLLLVLAAFCVIGGLTACGGGGGTKTVSPGTPTGTSSITVFSSSGGNTHSASVSLTVN